MSDPLELVIQQVDRRLGALTTDLAEVRSKTDMIPAINQHLKELNGRVAKNVLDIEANRRAIAVVAGELDGFELKDKLAAARADGVASAYAPLRRLASYVTRDGIVLKVGLALIGALVGIDVVTRLTG